MLDIADEPGLRIAFLLPGSGLITFISYYEWRQGNMSHF
jgi:hypothetical protein